MTLTPKLHADLFYCFKIAEREGSYESGQALCDHIKSFPRTTYTPIVIPPKTTCDPIYNASSDQTIMVTDGDQKWHTVEPNHWIAYYDKGSVLLPITISNADKIVIYTDPTIHDNLYGDGLSCNQTSCSHW